MGKKVVPHDINATRLIREVAQNVAYYEYGPKRPFLPILDSYLLSISLR